MSPDHERLTIKGVAALVQRSDRTVRRYLHEGLLEAERVDMDAGGWKYLITRDSAERLKERLAGGRRYDLTALTAQVQALQQTIEQQSEEIGALRKAISGLLPPARTEKRWWEFWRVRRSQRK